MEENATTPWRKIYLKFGMSQAEFARALGRHRSKVCVALRDEKGLINGRDQELILEAARNHKIDISPSDLIPSA